MFSVFHYKALIFEEAVRASSRARACALVRVCECVRASGCACERACVRARSCALVRVRVQNCPKSLTLHPSKTTPKDQFINTNE